MDYSESEFSGKQNQNMGEGADCLGRAVVRLEIRIQSLEIKIMSISKIVKLLQQYSEKKDQQYQKETHNLQLLQNKIKKIESIEAQNIKNTNRCEQISAHFTALTIKIDQVIKTANEKKTGIKELQQKLAYDLEQLGRKINKIETTMLQQIREGSKNIEQSKIQPIASQNYAIQELTFKINEFKNSSNAENQKIKNKLEKIDKKVKKIMIKQTDQYGIFPDRQGNSKNKGGKTERQSLNIKRMKSK